MDDTKDIEMEDIQQNGEIDFTDMGQQGYQNGAMDFTDDPEMEGNQNGGLIFTDDPEEENCQDGGIIFTDEPEEEVHENGEIIFTDIPEEEGNQKGETFFNDDPEEENYQDGGIIFTDEPKEEVHENGEIIFTDIPEKDGNQKGETFFNDDPDKESYQNGAIIFTDNRKMEGNQNGAMEFSEDPEVKGYQPYGALDISEDMGMQGYKNGGSTHFTYNNQHRNQRKSKKFKYIGIGVGVCALLALILGLSIGLTQNKGEELQQTSTSTIPTTTTNIPVSSTTTVPSTTTSGIPSTTVPPDLNQRVNCFPEGDRDGPITETRCAERGCIFEPLSTPNVPSCFISFNADEHNHGYQVVSGANNTQFGAAVDVEETELGWSVELITRGESIFGTPITRIRFEVEMRGDDILRFTIDDADNPNRYKVPEEMLSLNLPENRAENPKYELRITNENPFAFSVIRRSTGTVIWQTGTGGFEFTDQFLQISNLLPSRNIYGLGENLHQSFRHDLNYKTWPAWARDQPPPSPEGDQNLYSVHPFYECVENDGNTHGVFLLNSNAMEFELTPEPMLTYRTVGGILDFYIFMGPSPESVTQQYTSAIGRPVMPPYWSLGFQLCRFNYENTQDIIDTVNRTLQYGIPLDVQYADIDHMYIRRSFTVDPERFGGLGDYFRELRDRGFHTIIILDPALEINDTYTAYVRGRDADIYIKWPDRESMPPGDYEEYNRTDMMGFVWPTWKTVFPDFFLNETESVWTSLVVDFWDELPFDGLWIDMNEPANFDTNGERPWNWPEDRPEEPWTLKCGNSSLDDPPYPTKAAYYYDSDSWRGRLSDKTLCMVGKQGPGGIYDHYDVHNLYGLSQTIATSKSLRTLFGEERRSFLVTRSSFPGSGHYAARWLGDNTAAWNDLRVSIIGMLEFNLFGIPYIGADICGFFGDSPAELCKRWQQLGAFYPYSRNHNHEDAQPQDPAHYGDEVAIPTREALLTRYTLLPYLYTLFHDAHVRGSTVVRPLHHEFPQDATALARDRQFMWGPALIFSPVLDPGVTRLDYYLPDAQWYDYYEGHSPIDGPTIRAVGVDTDEPVHIQIREGYIIPTQQPGINTNQSRQNPFGLKVALPRDVDPRRTRAEGVLFWDDGELLDSFEKGAYYWATFTAQLTKLNDGHYHGNLMMNVEHNDARANMEGLVLDTVDIHGVVAPPNDFTLNVYLGDDLNPHTDISYLATQQVLKITNLRLPMTESMEIEWRTGKKATAEQSMMLDCCPDGCSETECFNRTCSWNEVLDTPGVPWCSLVRNEYGYAVIDSDEAAGEYSLEWMGLNSMFEGDVENVNFTIQHYQNILRITINDAESESYEVPIELNLQPSTLESLSVNVTDDPFSFMVYRPDETIIWDTSIGGLTVTDTFLQIAAVIGCEHIYGFGENEHATFSHDMNFRKWGMFSRDEPPGPNINLYSVHPFYLCIEPDGRANGVFFFNSNAMEIVTLPTPGLIYRTTGGLLDIFFLSGDSPEEVVQRYHNLIGTTHIPPYFALGFQLSRYGYNNIEKLNDAVNRTLAAGIPMDVQHLDIDVLKERMDFTYDEINFPNLPEYLQNLREERHVRAVVILDPFLISNVTDYEPYERGLEQDVFIRWPEGMSPDFDINNNSILLGWAWPTGRVVYPDYFHPNASDYWAQLIVDYYDRDFKFDGLWIDMNDPASFGTDEERPWNWPEDVLPYWSLKCENDTEPRYKPVSVAGPKLTEKTICMVAEQNQGEYSHYDVHSLYGWSQTMPSLRGLQLATGNRSMLVSRSTYPSSGTMAGKWLGDNASIWVHMWRSIVGILEFNLFGIPYIGADVCGYFNDCPAQLCQRWMQLGAFYTFDRNHNGLNYQEQDPAYFGPEVAASSKAVLEVRYSLLPYLYTLFFWSHRDGGTVIRPLAHEFPDDPYARTIDRQFMWGNALLISPVLEENRYEVLAYIPDGRWFDFYSGEEVQGTGRSQYLTAPLDHIPLHVRGGQIIPTQQPAANTFESRQNNMTLIIAPEANGASGTLYWDDGDSIDPVGSGAYFLGNITYTIPVVVNSGEIVLTHLNDKAELVADVILDGVRLFGHPQCPTQFSIDGTVVEHINIVSCGGSNEQLVLSGLNQRGLRHFELTWIN